MRPKGSKICPVSGKAWHQKSSDEALSLTGSTRQGLPEQEAAARLVSNGANIIIRRNALSLVRMFLGQFKSLMIWLLIAAGIVAGIFGDLLDAVAILAIVTLNAVIGFYQEYSAGKSMAALRRMASPQSRVRRGGKVVLIPSRNIVTGDIIELEAGDLIPADARLLEVTSLQCIESVLTGESEAVAKQAKALAQGDLTPGDRTNMIHMGTTVAAGKGEAVVVATAMATELGKIAAMMEDAAAEQSTPLQRKLEDVGRILVWAALGIVALLFGLGLLRQVPLFELTMTAISLAVAAVPEGLPAVVTVALSLGVMRMARRHALVRRLVAVETLGSTSVICTDKTGTLTVGEMTARTLHVAGRTYEVTGEGYGPVGEVRLEGQKVDPGHAAALQELATVLLACNHAHLVKEDGIWKTIGDPTEGALLAAGHKMGGDRARIEREFTVYSGIPFDSTRKLSTVIRRCPDGGLRAFVNGAPGEVLERCTHLLTESGIKILTPEDRTLLLDLTSKMAGQALRVLASARRDFPAASAPPTDEPVPATVESDLTFVGLTGMYDPPRPEAKAAISKCRAAGIRVVMITGDHRHTAGAIARELGIVADGDAVTGKDLNLWRDEDWKTRVSTVDVYARVTAAHKLRIIRELKANGAVVAMTGDGVNDAPAIQGADIGIAMGKAGTEVTRQAADMILTDDNFATIVAAVEEGRGIYSNIRKTLQYLLAGSTAELLLMAVCVIAGLPAPLLPIHLLWINLVTDGLPALCLASDPIDPDVMRRNPRPRAEGMTNSAFLRTMGFTGFLTAAVVFAVYFIQLKSAGEDTARNYAFTTLVFAELLRAFGARSETKPLWRIPLATNKQLLTVVTGTIALQVLSQYHAGLGRFLKIAWMPPLDCLLLIEISAIPLLALEGMKVVRLTRIPSAPGGPARECLSQE